ncbi:hypothetical protein OG259_19625 [Streptomyces sp. NBC_00250]|uniref:hypothetical protein n=1 Tax=Streptomyces sp. NBC_00250 TaxID=2903641 RepID=UPI002E2E7EDB|nr:hypothetical protein [Streptomyces sp. NBC_00250]
MTEPVAGPVTETVAVPGTESVAEPMAKRGVRRVLIRVVLPSVLVLGLIGGGVTYTALTVSSADRTAPTRLWGTAEKSAQDKDPAAARARGKTGTPLSKLLLPLPEGYEFGPDEELYGNDGELGAADATALMKQAGEGLSGKKRRAFEKDVDKLGIEGIGVRSFADLNNDVVVSVELARMKDKKQIKNTYRLRKEVMDLLEFPKGPKVKDHRNAVCYLAPEDDSLDKKERAAALEEMICLAYDSEVFVIVKAAGAKPFDKARVAKLLTRQLDHIASPGEYV